MNRSKKKNDTQKKKETPSEPISQKKIIKTKDAESRTGNIEKEKQTKFDIIIKWGTFIVSGIAIIISILALVNSQKQTEISKQSLKFGNRPYVIVRKNESDIENQFDSFLIYIKNIGQTPAYNIRIFAEKIISNVDSVNLTNNDYSRMKEIKQIPFLENIPFGEAIILTDSLGIDEIDRESIKTKKVFLFIYGSAIYDDIFKDSHRTDFCFFYNSYWYKFYKKYNEAY